VFTAAPELRVAFGEFVMSKMPADYAVDFMGPYTACGFVDERGIQAAAIFTHSSGHDAFMSFASNSPRWATKRAFMKVLAFGFVLMGLKRITALINAGNERCLKLTEGVGFQQEGRMREATKSGEDVLIYGLLRSEWIGGKYGGNK
jgi:RimJ/RimL family protein N-acetyltransferase